MKFLSILAAASLALAPAIASAGSHGDSTANSRPISGPLGGQPPDDQAIGVYYGAAGAAAIFIAGLLLLIDDSSNDGTIGTTVGTTVGTNNGSQ